MRGRVLVMTAVPGAPGPRRLLLSPLARRGAGGLPAALAFGSVGLRFMVTSGISAGEERNAPPYIIRMVPLWFQIVVFLPTGACADPRSANYSRPRADRPRLERLRRIADNSRQGGGKLRIRPATPDRSDRQRLSLKGFPQAAGLCDLPAVARAIARRSAVADPAPVASRRGPDSAAEAIGVSSRGTSSVKEIAPTAARAELETRPCRRPGRCGAASRARSLHSGGLAELIFERLIRFLGKIGVEISQSSRLRDKTLVGALGVVALHLDCLVE